MFSSTTIFLMCPLLLLLSLNLASSQQLANELFPPPASLSSSSSNGNAPNEEELIQRLLKSPGLPPAGPPTKEEGGREEKEKDGPEAPSPSLAVTSFGGVAQQPSAAGPLPPSTPPSYVQCLHQIDARVCDPDEILSTKERQEIDETLKELEAATRKEKAASECERSGLKLMVILVRHSALLDDPMNSIQNKLNGVLGIWVREPEHKCEKPVILMLSADPQMMNRKVWTGRHWDVPVNPGELVKLFMEQEELTRKEKYCEVILNIIEGILNRYEKRALLT